jgi:hypothetical protein
MDFNTVLGHLQGKVYNKTCYNHHNQQNIFLLGLKWVEESKILMKYIIQGGL